MLKATKLALLSTSIISIQGFAMGFFSRYIIEYSESLTTIICYFAIFGTMSFFSHKSIMNIAIHYRSEPEVKHYSYKKRKGTNITDLIAHKKKRFKKED